MDNIINILITGGGAPGIVGTIYALKNNPDNVKFRIVSTDIDNDAIGRYLSDKFYKVPPPENKNYIPLLQEIAQKEKVKVIIPQTTREITVLAKRVSEFINIGVHVTVSSFESIKVANDKFLLLERAKKIGIPVPRFYLTDSEDTLIKAAELLGYPKKKIVVKPRKSNGMRGLRIVTKDPWDVQRFLRDKPDGVEITLEALLDILHRGNWPELLVTEYLPGNEYTIDVFRGKYGIVAVPRLRKKIRSGITFDAKIELRNDLIEYSIKLAKSLNLKYSFGFQFKLSEEGIPKLLECNPRVQGTMVAGVFAGFNFIYYSVMEAIGKPKKIDNIKLRDSLRFKRYWGGIGIYGNKLIGKI